MEITLVIRACSLCTGACHIEFTIVSRGGFKHNIVKAKPQQPCKYFGVLRSKQTSRRLPAFERN